MELDQSTFLTSVILQSYSHEDSMALAQKQKYRPMEQDRKNQKLTHAPMGTLFFTKEARIYNGLKRISLASGAGKTGQPLVK